MGKKRKHKWWCEECGHEWKVKGIRVKKCPDCKSKSVFLCKRNKSREVHTFEEFVEFIDSLDDAEIYEGSLEVCDCEPPGVCDICQGVYPYGAKMLDNIECELCGEFKQPHEFISVVDRHCRECHDKMHEQEPINQGHYFEIMDRTHVVQCQIDDFIYDHPAISKEMKKKVYTVLEILTEVYQWAGSEWDNFDTTTMKVSG